MGLKVDKIISLKGKYLETIFKRKGIKLTYVKMRFPSQPKNSPPVFELHYWQNPKRPPNSGYNHISFTIKNLDYEYKRLKRRGVKFISGPKVSADKRTKICFAYDPDRHLIEFIEDLRIKK